MLLYPACVFGTSKVKLNKAVFLQKGVACCLDTYKSDLSYELARAWSRPALHYNKTGGLPNANIDIVITMSQVLMPPRLMCQS